MISLLNLNKLIYFTLINIFIFNFTISYAAVDIWEKKENKNNSTDLKNSEQEIKIESPILSDDINKIKISEDEIGDTEKTVIGIFDPEKNNFNLNMWADSDGEDIKKILK